MSVRRRLVRSHSSFSLSVHMFDPYPCSIRSKLFFLIIKISISFIYKGTTLHYRAGHSHALKNFPKLCFVLKHMRLTVSFFKKIKNSFSIKQRQLSLFFRFGFLFLDLLPKIRCDAQHQYLWIKCIHNINTFLIGAGLLRHYFWCILVLCCDKGQFFR